MRRFSTRQPHLGTLAELNVTPLLDLAFVLLVIFMITAPLLRQGMELVIPTTKAEQEATPPDKILTLSVDRDRHLTLDGSAVEQDQLGHSLHDLLAEKPDLAVVIESHQSLPVQAVVDLMEIAKTAGLTRIGIITRQEAAP